jgi:hypothetical protein
MFEHGVDNLDAFKFIPCFKIVQERHHRGYDEVPQALVCISLW